MHLSNDDETDISNLQSVMVFQAIILFILAWKPVMHLSNDDETDVSNFQSVKNCL